MRLARILTLTLLAVSLSTVSACSSTPDGPQIEYYHTAYRQLPPEPVYSRVTWSNLPGPIKPRVHDTAPMMMPTMQFELPKTTVGEAVQALAQAIGYTWSYSDDIAGRPVAIKMTAPVDEILREISRQGQVYGILDHDQRVVRVVSRAAISPQLPQSGLPNS